MSEFTQVRDVAVAVGRTATCLTVEQVEQAIAEAEHAQAVGPIVDPSAFMQGVGELNKQLKYLRAFRDFRRTIEELRP